MGTEVEIKFRARSAGPLDELAEIEGLAGVELGVPRTVEEIDRYLDTADGRLAAARWACRLRERDGGHRVSLKGPAMKSARSWLHRRPEEEGPATALTEPAAWPSSEARDLLDELRGGRALTEQFRLQQRRTERSVSLDGRRVGTMTLDRVEIIGKGTLAGALHVVELELDDPERIEDALVDRLASGLAARPGLEPEDRTKLEHALDLLRDR